MSSFASKPETKSASSTSPTIFYTSSFPCPENARKECFNKSVALSTAGIARNKYNHFTPPKPRCTNNHCMVISSSNEGGYAAGYCCALCNGNSSQGHCGGEMKRWFCQPCGADICFQCHPEKDLSKCPECLHERVEGWKLDQCADCKAYLGALRLAEEQRRAQIVKDEDSAFIGSTTTTTMEEEKKEVDHIKERAETREANMNLDVIDLDREKHATRIHNLGITVEALIAFAYQHDCWDWTTYKVVRDIIVPATRDTRCRYGDLPEVSSCFGPATVFMSHCWGAKFGDLIGAACHGAKKDRIVWIDIFAVRQWPGNVADLDFRGVIKKCAALLVSTSPVDGLKEFMPQGINGEYATYLATDEGKAAQKTLPFCRLWCIVEIAAAIKLNVPIVVKGGSVRRSNGTWGRYEYDTKCIGSLMANLQYMIDVEVSECAVPADKVREIAVVRSLEGGAKGVNALVAGVVAGAVYSISNNILEIDAFVCNEPESLRALDIPFGCTGDKKLLARKVFKAACGGGRQSIVKELFLKWGVKEEDDKEKEEETKRNGSMKKEKKKKKEIVYNENDGRLYFVCIHANGVACRNSLVMDDRCEEISGPFNHECVVGTLTEDGQWICIVESNNEKQNGTFLPMTVGDDILFKRITTKMEWIKLQKTERLKWLIQLIDDSQVLWGTSNGGHTCVVKILLEVIGINVNAANNSRTPLYDSCFQGFVDIVKVLLAAKDTDVNQANKEGSTPLYIASYKGHTDIVKVLLAAKDININQAKKDGRTPLYIASERGHTDIVKILLATKDIDVNKASKEGVTPLYIASQEGHTDVIKQLLTMSGLDLNKDFKGTSPLKIAITNTHTEIVQLLKDAGATYTMKEAVAANDTNYVQEWITNDKEKDKKEINESLYDASSIGNIRILELLIEAGGDVNKTNNNEETPLNIASDKGHIQIVRYLLQQPNVDINKRDKWKNSPLINAKKKKHLDIVQCLTDAGAVYFVHNAVQCNDIDFIKEWLGKDDADVNAFDDTLLGWSLLGIAIGCEHINIVKLLLSVDGIDVNHQVGGDVPAPLIFASIQGNVEIVRLLLQEPSIDLDKKFKDISAFSIAIQKDHHEIVQLLTDAGAIPSTKFYRGTSDQIGVHTDTKCAKSHGLVRFNTPWLGFNCDICSLEVPESTILYGCDECQYDICESCEGGSPVESKKNNTSNEDTSTSTEHNCETKSSSTTSSSSSNSSTCTTTE